jgi:hypothetical protein
MSLTGLLRTLPIAAALAAGAAAADGVLPQLGVDARPRRGFFAEASLGAFTVVGGSRALSSAQPALGMAIGRDLGERSALFIQLGVGSGSASCFDGPGGACRGADSFGITFVELGLRYGVPLLARLRLSGQAVGGLSVLSPAPIYDAAARRVPDSLSGPHFGLGAALDYDTRLDHFAVGVDVLGRYTAARRPDRGTFSLVSFALMPRIRYVF